MCVCVCVCVFKCVSLNDTYKFCIIYLYYFKFPDKFLSFRQELVDEFPKIVPSAFRPFIWTILGNSSSNSNLKLR